VRAIQRLVVIAALAALVGYSVFGTLSPCSVLRDSARRLDGLAAILSDDILDQVIEAQYGALSPGRCVAIMLSNQNILAFNVSPRSPIPHWAATKTTAR
jgi:hypothetical protein